MRKSEIIGTNDGFAILTVDRTDAVSFNRVSAIIAYKLDELTTDPFC